MDGFFSLCASRKPILSKSRLKSLFLVNRIGRSGVFSLNDA